MMANIAPVPSQCDAMAVPSLKLIYLNHHYWRAECIRLALHIAHVPFEDARMTYDEMYSSGALTFGTFPSLVVGGKGVINQTQAIARYVGHLAGLYPGDPFLAAKCDEAIDALTDVSELVTATMQERDMKRKVQWRQHLIASNGRITMLLNGLESLLKQNNATPIPFVAGTTLSVADLAIWRAVGWISSSVLDVRPNMTLSHSIGLSIPHRRTAHPTPPSLPPPAQRPRPREGGVGS